MKSKSWLAWAVVCTAAVASIKWIQADERPEANPIIVAQAPPRVVPVAQGADEKEPPALNGPSFGIPNVIEAANTTAQEDEEVSPIPDVAPEMKNPVQQVGADQPGNFTFPAEKYPLDSGTGSDMMNKQTEQAVTLEWVGPAQIKVGHPFTYELVVRNIGGTPVENVIVRDKFPQGMKINKVEPAGQREDDGYVWRIGSLRSRQETRIKIEMTAERKGDVVCHATVTATSPATATFRVSEPLLTIKQSSPDKVMLGDPVSVTIAVSNPGDGRADNVTIRSVLSDGLKHEKGKDFSYDLGSLGAGETRTVQMVCSTVKGGAQTIDSVATADGGLKAEAKSTTLVTEPKLLVEIDGPGLRYLDRQATYKVKVTNPGDAAASNVKLMVAMPAGFKHLGSTNGGRHDYTTRTIGWFMGSIEAGQTKEVAYKCVATQAGAQKHVANAMGHRGLKASDEAVTNVEGISALLLEVVDIDDPVEVGSDTSYEIRVTNQGSRAATNVEIHALVPKEMQIRGGQGPSNYQTKGQEIIFAPLPKLAPRADAIFRVFVRGTGVGDLRFRARLLSDSLTEPVIEEESTKVYDD